MKKEINEFTTGYPTSIGNAQSQEYQGILGPIDAETVQGKDRFNPETTEGIHRLNVFLKHFFRKTTLNPHYEVAQLRARLNHLGYDFDFDNQTPVGPTQTFKVGKTEVFGTTPTTDLSKGFDTGSDVPTMSLTITSSQTDHGFKLDGTMSKISSVEEAAKPSREDDEKMKRQKRIEFIKYIKDKKDNKDNKDKKKN